MDLPPVPSYEQTIEALAECGLPADKVQIRYDDFLGLDTVTIGTLDEVPDEEFSMCVHEATTLSGYDVQFADTGQSSAFNGYVAEAIMQDVQRDSADWLRDRQLLESMPVFDPDIGLQTFAADAEQHCGLEQGAILRVLNATSYTLNIGYFALLTEITDESHHHLSCVMSVMSVNRLDQHNISLGFIGNDVRPTEEVEQ
ncbi:MAG: hypothetical protein ACTS1Z_08365 [Parasphingopyxis sp.]|uniref:hypothetical protein n=1 Tax=Parasphingopyxis sp. TaxID=1920299 RepID=UPI003FA13289